ncbi:MAG: 2-C-methyl-D-erythritol 4-phosphate cytidylyltransferase [Candidatus Omnitrophica bacterium]|nr:2-C-methyl-D-erythritol 4-phosphate cytidylyltransferase [Candidatus Omnitrophota bacterium]
MVDFRPAAAIVLTAGRSTRMGGRENKVLHPLGDRPVLAYSLAVFQACRSIDYVVIVGREEERAVLESTARMYCPKAEGHFAVGGVERFDSVRNGLEACAAFHPEAVLIHDAARPFVRERFIISSLNALETYPGAVVGVPLKDTLKEIRPDATVIRTHERSRFWLSQTPQTFRYPDILNACRAYTPPPYPTDDGAVLEWAGGTVAMVEGSYLNIKLTTPEDWILAEAIRKIPFD